MTSRTRGRLMICLILGLITFPVEALLLPVAITPNAAAAAVAYTAALSPEELNAAAAVHRRICVDVRRAIMRELTPDRRADVWRAQFQNYLDTHPGLTPAQAAVVREAMTVASPAAFAPPVSAEVRDRISQVFNRALVELGPQTSSELFVTLGPRVLARPSALPLTQRLADRVRSWRVASAAIGDCNCNIDIDTCDLVPDPSLLCSELYDCVFDLDWPMCGPLWSWACTGWCKIIRWPSGGGSD